MLYVVKMAINWVAAGNKSQNYLLIFDNQIIFINFGVDLIPKTTEIYYDT